MTSCCQGRLQCLSDSVRSVLSPCSLEHALANWLGTVCCRLIPPGCAPAVVSEVSLAAELDLLLHLIALPPGISCKSSPDALPQQQPRFRTGAVAAMYAAQVLSLSGALAVLHAPYVALLACSQIAQGVSWLDGLVTADMHTCRFWVCEVSWSLSFSKALAHSCGPKLFMPYMQRLLVTEHLPKHAVMQAGWFQAWGSLCLKAWKGYQSYRTIAQRSWQWYIWS